jgi:hypothetical protein
MRSVGRARGDGGASPSASRRSLHCKRHILALKKSELRQANRACAPNSEVLTLEEFDSASMETAWLDRYVGSGFRAAV